MSNAMIYVLIAIFVFIAYKFISSRSGKNRISQSKAKEMMEGDVIILDVREKNEYNTGHIKNAISAPLSNLENRISKITKDKSKTLLIYCQTGARSNTATIKLVSLGYTNAFNFGGITTWRY